MKRILVSAIYVLGIMIGVLTSLPVLAVNTDIDFILDVSGSMNKVVGGESQIESARKALANALASVPAGGNVALRVYAHRVPQTKKEESCKDTELFVPMGPANVDLLKTKVATLTPLGYTPIAYSLEQSRNDFDLTREANKVIILISDGEETCGGDPIAVINKLKADGFNVTINAIGINPDEATQKLLRAIADAGGGKYYDANGAQGLLDAVKQATQASLTYIDKPKTTYGTDTRGGNSYETAVPMPLDIESRLDHLLKDKQYDYFYLDLKPGQLVTIELKKLETGAIGFAIHDSSRQEVKAVYSVDNAYQTRTDTYLVSRAGRYYILIGNPRLIGGTVTQDDTFKVTIVSKGDLSTDQDAGDTLQTALPIEAKTYPANYIGGGDEQDFFTFRAQKSEQYFVGLIPNQDSTASLWIEISDEYRQRITGEYNGGSGQGIKSKPFTIPDTGTYLIKIKDDGGSMLAYTLKLERLAASAISAQSSPSTADVPLTTSNPSVRAKEVAASPAPAAKHWWGCGLVDE